MKILLKDCYRQFYDEVLDKYSEPRLISTTEYDSKGNKIRQEHYGSDAYVLNYKHDENGNLLEEKLYDEEMDYYCTIIRKYNKENKVISESINNTGEGYDYGGWEELYRYNNAQGNLIRETASKGRCKEIKTYKYTYTDFP